MSVTDRQTTYVPNPSLPASLPDPERCIAAPMAGVVEIALCRVDGGYLCPHVLPFGDEHFCRHPERARFVVRLLERA